MGRPATNTKQRLLNVATELIWRESYGAVSVDDICTKAEVQKGSFYHYFPSKADLALATMDECMGKAKALYDDIFSPTRPPVERLERLCTHIYEQQAEIARQMGHVCGCPVSSLGCELAGQDDRLAARINDIYKKSITYYESVLRDLVAEGTIDPGTDIKVKAEEIYAFLMGHMLMARIKNDLSFIRDHLKPSLFQLIGIKE